MRATPENIQEISPVHIFVFGSNLEGNHAGGAARLAFNKFGAIWGKGEGLQGQSYAIPTMFDSVEKIKFYADTFCVYAKASQDKIFLVTEIGCGIAGFMPEEIAPLFKNTTELENVYLPKRFWNVLNNQ